jgi:hypothetical protein
MELSSAFYVAAASASAHCIGCWMSPRAGLDGVLRLPQIEPQFLRVCSLVTILSYPVTLRE